MKNLNNIETREEYVEFMESQPFRVKPATPEEKQKVLIYCEKFNVSTNIMRLHDDIFPHK